MYEGDNYKFLMCIRTCISHRSKRDQIVQIELTITNQLRIETRSVSCISVREPIQFG